MFDLYKKVAIVTGGTKGIGKEIALRLAKEGADVIVVSRHQEDCDRVSEAIKSAGGKALGISCDVTQSDHISRLIKSVMDFFQRIDILVNNAGVAVTKPAEDISESEWDHVINVNLKGVFLLSQAVGRQMITQKQGRIINISSIFGMVGSKNILPYLCSKGGVMQLTKGLALEWSKYNILVNAVAPGYVITPINKKELSEERVANTLLKRIPLRRFATEEEIASIVAYLASDEASYITGTVFSVDGGWTAQ